MSDYIILDEFMMWISKFGNCAESLQKGKIESLKKDLKSQTKFFIITIDILEKDHEIFTNSRNLQEVHIDNGGKEAVVNAKLFLDTNKQLGDIKTNFNFSEHDNKNIMR